MRERGFVQTCAAAGLRPAGLAGRRKRLEPDYVAPAQHMRRLFRIGTQALSVVQNSPEMRKSVSRLRLTGE